MLLYHIRVHFLTRYFWLLFCIDALLFLCNILFLEKPFDLNNCNNQNFNPFTIAVALVKAFVFGFIITSVPAYEGFYVKGGALEVAQASTRAVVVSCISILACDYLVTGLML